MTAGKWGSMFVMFLTINIFMYIGLGSGGQFLYDGDLLSNFVVMDINATDDFLGAGASDSINFTTTITDPADFQPLTASGSANLFQFLDALQVVKNFFKTVINVLFAPITLFKYGEMPSFIVLLMIPYCVLFVVSFIQFVRGAS